MIKYYSAGWCTPCKTFKASLLEGDLDGVTIVDADHEPDEIHEAGIRSIPTFIKFDADGNEIDRITGTMTRSRFLAWKDE